MSDNKNTVFLFNYYKDNDHEKYTATYRDIYINSETGEFLTHTVVNRDTHSLRVGSASIYEHSITYEEYLKIIELYNVENAEKFKALNPNNYKEWLVEHKYV